MAAMLCVLLGHALIVLALRDLVRVDPRALAPQSQDAFVSELFFIVEDEHAASSLADITPRLTTFSRLPLLTILFVTRSGSSAAVSRTCPLLPQPTTSAKSKTVTMFLCMAPPGRHRALQSLAVPTP